MAKKRATRLYSNKKWQNSWYFVKYANDYAQGTLFSIFDRFGKNTAKYPSITVGICMIFVSFSVACLFSATQDATSIFWVPRGSDLFKEQEYFLKTFSRPYRLNAFIMEPTKSPDAVDSDFLLEVVYIHRYINNITCPFENTTLKFTDVCSRPTGTRYCVLGTILDYWMPQQRAVGTWNTTAIASESREEMLDRLNTDIRSPRGNTLFKPVYFGDPTYDNNGKLKSVATFRSIYGTDANPENLQKSQAWEAAYISGIEELIPNLNHTKLYYTSARSYSDLSDDSGNILATYTVSFVVMLLYTACTLGRFNFYQSRFWLTIAGYLIIVFSLASGLGWGALFGIGVNAITLLITPVIVFTLGINNMYVMTGDFDARNHGLKHKQPLQRLRKMIKNVGVTVFMVTLVNMLAFLIGSNTTIPVAQNFCYTTIICILILFVLQMTMWNALIVLDARRADAKRVDLCCIRSKCGNAGLKRDEPLLKTFSKKWYLPLLSKRPTQVIVVVGFAALFGVCLWGAITVPIGLDLETILPNGNYYMEYRDAFMHWFPSLGNQVWLVLADWRNPDFRLNYSDPKIQSTVVEMHGKLKDTEWVLGDANFWLKDFYRWLEWDSNHTSELIREQAYPNLPEFTIPADEFNPWLVEFLNTSYGVYYNGDIIFDSEWRIAATRAATYFLRANDTLDNVNSITDIRNLMDPYSKDVPSFSYASGYTYYAQYLGFYGDQVINLAVILAILLIFGLIIFKSVTAAALNVLLVFLILVTVIGFMNFSDIPLNSLNMFYILWLAGFAQESCAHFTLKFLQNEGTRRERSDKAFTDIETHFFNAILANIIGHLVVQIFTDSPLFRDYFGRLPIIIAGVVGLYAVVLLPVLFTLLGPRSFSTSRQKERQASNANLDIELPELDGFFAEETEVAVNDKSRHDSLVSSHSRLPEGVEAPSPV